MALNVTAVGPSADGFVTVWPAGAVQPTASNLNLRVGVTVPNMVIVPLGADGKVSIFNDSGTTNLLVDVLGWFPTTTQMSSPNPARASVGPDGLQTFGYSLDPAISADGRYVAFRSIASNLVAGDTNAKADVFVFDRTNSVTTRVSVGPAGLQADNESTYPAISADGRFITYSSDATNLVTGDTNAKSDVFVFDRTTSTTTRVSVGPAGVQANGDSRNGQQISADGRYIAFRSIASNLVTGDTNATSDVFVFDRTTSTTTRVSVGPAGLQADNGSYEPAISADGRLVAFRSDASNLVAGDTNAKSDVFVFDRSTSATTRVSVGPAGAQANGDSIEPAISADGRYVAFESLASDLVAGDTNAKSDAFVFDRTTSAATRVSVAPAGAQADSDCYNPAISADGRYITFESDASNLVAGDTNAKSDVFVFDRTASTTTRVSVGPAGVQANLGSSSSAMSSDGRYITFESSATNLIASDSNASSDVFVFDQGTI